MLTSTGFIVDNALVPVSKQADSPICAVTAQGLQSLFTAKESVSAQFLVYVRAALNSDHDKVVDALSASLKDMPHQSKKTPNVSDALHAAYGRAQKARSEFRTLYGATRFAGFTNWPEYKHDALEGARAALEAAGLDWTGKASKDAREAAAEAEQAVKSAKMEAELVRKGFTDDQLSALREAAEAAQASEAIQAKLESMAKAARKGADGLVKYYDGSLQLAIAHAEAMLAALMADAKAHAVAVEGEARAMNA